MRRRGLHPRTIGLLAIAVVIVVTAAIFHKDNPFDDPFTVRAAFTNADRVRNGAPVRIAGVDVGRVVATEAGPTPGSAILVMEIAEAGLPLHADVRFKVRPRIFLDGNFFVEASPGSPSAPVLEADATVPATQTAAAVPVGEVLRIFDRQTREDVGTVLDEFGRGLSGGGAEAFNRTLGFAEPAFKNGARVSEAARGIAADDLSVYVRNAARVAEGLARNPQQLQALVTNIATAAGALADVQTDLSATVDELPRTLEAGEEALASVDAALPDVRRLARELTPVVERSPRTLEAALPFAQQLRAAVSPAELGGLSRDLRGVSGSLAHVLRGGLDIQSEVRLLASCTSGVLLPTTAQEIPDARFPAQGPVYEEAAKFTTGVAGGGRNFDANGLYSRTFAPSANFIYPIEGAQKRFFFNTQPIRGINPAPAPLPPLRGDVACETQDPPDLRSNPLPAPTEINAMPTLRSGKLLPEPPTRRQIRKAMGG